jgi:hypothetical protein
VTYPVVCGLLGAALGLVAASAAAQSVIPSDQDHPAPFNYGYGPGVRVPGAQVSAWNRLLGRGQTPVQTEQAIAGLAHQLVAPPSQGTAVAASQGMFGSVLPWPIIPLHMALLPDGRVMTYGTDENGKQGALLWYDVWDPTLPYETSHTVLANTTSTDIFCSGMGLLPNGSLLITGGDLTINGVRNYSNPNATLFTPASDTLTSDGVMNTPRWYPADVPLANGDQFIVGGRSGAKPAVPATVPEYYSVAANIFSLLPGAAVSSSAAWFYPKVYLGSSGPLFLVTPGGLIAIYGTAAPGSFQALRTRAAGGLYNVPTAMYQPGRLLSVRKVAAQSATQESYVVNSIDLTGAAPVVTRMPDLPAAGRQWSDMTVLADGRVLVDGGSGADNVLSLVSYTAYLFDPAAKSWSQAATAAEPRLYHSASLLLADGTVLTGGGGAPGPVNELNAEIYYPPYLFNADGSYAVRPVIASAPASIAAGQAFTVTMGDASPVGRVTLSRLGAVTHSTTLQARFVEPVWSQNGSTLTVTPPANTNDLLTGYWMVFVFNAAGVPSVAKIVDVPPPAGG